MLKFFYWSLRVNKKANTMGFLFPLSLSLNQIVMIMFKIHIPIASMIPKSFRYSRALLRIGNVGDGANFFYMSNKSAQYKSVKIGKKWNCRGNKPSGLLVSSGIKDSKTNISTEANTFIIDRNASHRPQYKDQKNAKHVS